ncbi:hypothetical protein [Clostridium sp.]|uniref:hypothetical protein n=1 Tax=Clostridium sp. TaxID=1506 RepID=UPI002FC9AAA8
MKIKMLPTAFIVALLWIVQVILNIFAIIILRENKSFLIVLSPMIIILIVLSVFNIVNFLNIYNDFVTISQNSIIVNYGLVYKKKELLLTDICKVKYSRSNITFYMSNGTKRNLSLTFISKGDEMEIYKFLTSNSINIVM